MEGEYASSTPGHNIPGTPESFHSFTQPQQQQQQFHQHHHAYAQNQNQNQNHSSHPMSKDGTASTTTFFTANSSPALASSEGRFQDNYSHNLEPETHQQQHASVPSSPQHSRTAAVPPGDAQPTTPPSTNTRSAAIAKLKRAASLREMGANRAAGGRQARGAAAQQDAPSSSSSSSKPASPRAQGFSAIPQQTDRTVDDDEDRSSYATASLSRQLSDAARSLAMAKLEGGSSPSPIPLPPKFPLPAFFNQQHSPYPVRSPPFNQTPATPTSEVSEELRSAAAGQGGQQAEKEVSPSQQTIKSPKLRQLRLGSISSLNGDFPVSPILRRSNTVSGAEGMPRSMTSRVRTPAGSASGVGLSYIYTPPEHVTRSSTPNELEGEEEEERLARVKVAERQAARTNLMRKLSRSRLVGAGAGAGAAGAAGLGHQRMRSEGAEGSRRVGFGFETGVGESTRVAVGYGTGLGLGSRSGSGSGTGSGLDMPIPMRRRSGSVNDLLTRSFGSHNQEVLNAAAMLRGDDDGGEGGVVDTQEVLSEGGGNPRGRDVSSPEVLVEADGDRDGDYASGSRPVSQTSVSTEARSSMESNWASSMKSTTDTSISHSHSRDNSNSHSVPPLPPNRTLATPINRKTDDGFDGVCGGPPTPSSLASTPRHNNLSSPHSHSHSRADHRSPSQYSNTSSQFRPYRHSEERDRDSAMARLVAEDHFEYARMLGRSPLMSVSPGNLSNQDTDANADADANASPLPPLSDGSPALDHRTSPPSVAVRSPYSSMMRSPDVSPSPSSSRSLEASLHGVRIVSDSSRAGSSGGIPIMFSRSGSGPGRPSTGESESSSPRLYYGRSPEARQSFPATISASASTASLVDGDGTAEGEGEGDDGLRPGNADVAGSVEQDSGRNRAGEDVEGLGEDWMDGMDSPRALDLTLRTSFGSGSPGGGRSRDSSNRITLHPTAPADYKFPPSPSLSSAAPTPRAVQFPKEYGVDRNSLDASSSRDDAHLVESGSASVRTGEGDSFSDPSVHEGEGRRVLEEHWREPPSSRPVETVPQEDRHDAQRSSRDRFQPPDTARPSDFRNGSRQGSIQSSTSVIGVSAPPPSNTVTFHMPTATAADLEKYGSSKLAPFPGLFNLQKERQAKAGHDTPPDSGRSSPEVTIKVRSDGGTSKAVRISAGSRHAAKSSIDRSISSHDSPTQSPTAVAFFSKYNRQQHPLPSPSSSSSESLPSAETPEIPKNPVLAKLDSLLSSHAIDPSKPSVLDNPPRKLLLHAPVLQIVNANTVKDRYLFLYNDILVIAKPLVEDDPKTGAPRMPTLETKFVAKSIVELQKVKLSALREDEAQDDPVNKKKHPMLLAFVDRFANDPNRAITTLTTKGGLSDDPGTIANLLFRTPELNRSKLGVYLSTPANRPILDAYIGRFKLAGIRLDDSLRIFILSLRLPNDFNAAEYLLNVFAAQWLAVNPQLGFDLSVTERLVLSVMELNDALHSGIEDDDSVGANNLFSFPNHAISVDDFIGAFRVRDTHNMVPDELLTRIYASIRKGRLEQAADNSIAWISPEVEATMHPSKLPTRLTFRVPADPITITIPEPDPQFAIKLQGPDLRFDPPFLTFARSTSQSFRVTGTGLGSKTMLLIKLGSHAPRYHGLPLNKTFHVERAYMRHTFHVSFYNHLGVKRKYMFSMTDGARRDAWVEALCSSIAARVAVPRPLSTAARNAESVALQVLRDALIAPEEAPAPLQPPNRLGVPHLGKPGSGRPGSGRPGSGHPSNIRPGTLQRSNSISKTYAYGQGKEEGSLPVGQGVTVSACNGTTGTGLISDGAIASPKTGHEIILTCQQNSLLPLVLRFLGAGAEAVNRPVPASIGQVHANAAGLIKSLSTR